MAHIVVAPHEGRVKIIWHGHVVADSVRALDLREGTAAPVLYVPREDADLAFFEKTTRSTRCPYKGDASYFTLRDDTEAAPNAVWSYETPIEAVRQIKNHLAFYPQQIRVEIGDAS